MRVFLHAITITIIQSGIYFWCSIKDFNSELSNLYYVWDKLTMLLLVLCCIKPTKTMLPFWVTIGILFAIRLAAEFISVFYDISKILFTFHSLFLINIVCTLLVIRIVLKCPK